MSQILHCTTAQTFKWKLINTKKYTFLYKKNNSLKTEFCKKNPSKYYL